MKIIETKEISKTLFAVLTAGILTLVGCQETNEKPEMISSSREVASSSQSSEEPTPESQSSEPEQEEEVIPEAPEIEYSEWVLGEWTTEVQEENDLCRLADQQTKSEPVYSEWSAWSTEYVEASDTREVTTQVKKDKIIDYYMDVPMYDKNGWEIPGKTATVPVYKMDEYGYWIYEEQTFYSYRDLISTNTYTLYQYETREVINQEEIDAYYEQYPEAMDEKKLALTQE